MSWRLPGGLLGLKRFPRVLPVSWGDSVWCLQVAGSVSTTGSWHQNKASSFTNRQRHDFHAVPWRCTPSSPFLITNKPVLADERSYVLISVNSMSREDQGHPSDLLDRPRNLGLRRH